MNFIKINKFLLVGLLIFLFSIGLASGFQIGKQSSNKKYTARCMKYFGNQGYPNNFYCKLFVEEIKARDE